MFTAHRATFATTLFATVVSALVLTSTQGQARDEAGSASAVRSAQPVVVHPLPRVVVTGQVSRAEAARVVDLPRVVVSGRRAGAQRTWLGQLGHGAVGLRA